jgi:NADPH-dependent 2,4-dienoyl-CoA reductase/sulfur reductase-like enzyme
MMDASSRVVVVGASLAGLRACEAARRLGYEGHLTLVGAEDHLPYDRPPLSKEYLDAGDAPDAPHFPVALTLSHDFDVELRLGEPATRLDLADRHVVTTSGRVAYDALLVATGAHARTLPGSDRLSGVHTLRTLDDAVAIRAALDSGARTVVIGAGFIGSELASSARKRGLPVTVVEALPTPLVRAVGGPAGVALAALHGRNGTDLRCGVGVEALVGQDRVEAVRLADGTELPADLVVVGVGAAPATDWLEGSGLTIDNGVVCDENLRAAGSVWAAGDVARWMSPDFGVLLRLEHWTNAADQAAHAMANLLDPAAATPYSHVPYFWSDWYDSRIQFAGLPIGEPHVVTGEWDGEAFTALYREGERLIGVLTLNRRADIMKYRALIARGGTWQDGLDLAAVRNAAAPVRVAATT